MSNALARFTRVELTEDGLRSGRCRQRIGTVTGYDARGDLVVKPDGLLLAQSYPPSYWRPISTAALRRGAALPRGVVK